MGNCKSKMKTPRCLVGRGAEPETQARYWVIRTQKLEEGLHSGRSREFFFLFLILTYLAMLGLSCST